MLIAELVVIDVFVSVGLRVILTFLLDVPVSLPLDGLILDVSVLSF